MFTTVSSGLHRIEAHPPEPSWQLAKSNNLLIVNINDFP
ncbi:MAG: hypothetical protein OP8BY_1171 [Candidatus Saccharicenans subterraneus]|uniref:Uncharacterized protein n=1 Tax=Candidatus Saccharicenans subterraneus TaxID=2508984 RepID=A0A3E2BJQ8_9BACT|nr:MAG: hypothetical protein OP8BY_1171 [Candidatus Saccharicenans subterraneum]